MCSKQEKTISKKRTDTKRYSDRSACPSSGGDMDQFRLNGKFCIEFIDHYSLITELLHNMRHSDVTLLCESQVAHSGIPDALRDNGLQFMNDGFSNYF